MSARTMPPYYGREEIIIAGDQSAEQIMEEVFNSHGVFKNDYNRLIDWVRPGRPMDIAREVFNLCKQSIRYSIEGADLQTTRSPARVLSMGVGDCKHYAGFAAGLLDAMRRAYGYDYKLFYRFASYDWMDTTPAHVFVVMKDNGVEYWIDPVLKNFNQRTPLPAYHIDKKIPMSIQRLSGLSPANQFPPSYQVGALTAGSLYDMAAKKVGAEIDKAVANIPFVGLAQGLLQQFFGPGGLSDWLTPAGILNEIKSALFGRMYTKGQYTLGERFRYYVLGENIHTNDADVVTDAVVGTAITVLSVGFGIPITTNEDLEALDKGADFYISRFVNYGGIAASEINREAVSRAVLLKQTYFAGPAQGNYAASGVAPQKWDLNNFNKIAYVIPIPDFTRLTAREMWANTYTGKIPDGEVKDGVVVAGGSGGGFSVAPGAKGSGLNQWLLIGGGLVLAYLIFRKK